MPQNHIPPPNDYTPRHPNRYGSPQERPRGDNRDSFKSNQIRQNKQNPSQYCQRNRNDLKNNQHQQANRNHQDPHENYYQNTSKPRKTPSKSSGNGLFRDDDDYFCNIVEDETVQDTESSQLDEQNHSHKDNNDNIAHKVDQSEEEEDDPLDAYMKSLEGAVEDSEGGNESKNNIELKDGETGKAVDQSKPTTSNMGSMNERGVRLDIDDYDETEDVYYATRLRSNQDDDDSCDDETVDRDHEIEYDDDDNILSVYRPKKEVEPLPPVDHSTIEYNKFDRNFYKEHPDIENLTTEQGDALRMKLEIKVTGQSPPKPVCSFAHFNFDEQLMRVIRRSEYTQPTPIQSQAIPAAMQGRNIIGIAITGSGKTAAYLWPMIAHIMGQPNLKQGDGPIGLVLVPTRELALQVYGQAKKFSHSYNIAVVCAYGGVSRYEQSQDLEAGAEIVIATPGRLIDLIRMEATNLRRVTYFVLDEADRFFDLGFEPQVRSICDQIRPDRQTLLFSATFKHKTEQLARKIIQDPIKIVQKNLGEVNEDVCQHIISLPDACKKWDWLLDRLVQFTSAGSLLIFVSRKINSQELFKNLKEHGKEVLLLHGDMEQVERNHVITSFKRKDKDILIATDVAARGLDISHIRTVVNYDVARDIDTHIHRIGRTGRAGSKGDAYTLITDKDKDFAGLLVKNLELSNEKISDDLMRIAMQSQSFRKSRIHSKNQSNTNVKQQHQRNNNPLDSRHRHPIHYSNKKRRVV